MQEPGDTRAWSAPPDGVVALLPFYAGLREHPALWGNDERPHWPGAGTPALLLNRHGGRMPARGGPRHPADTIEHVG